MAGFVRFLLLEISGRASVTDPGEPAQEFFPPPQSLMQKRCHLWLSPLPLRQRERAGVRRFRHHQCEGGRIGVVHDSKQGTAGAFSDALRNAEMLLVSMASDITSSFGRQREIDRRAGGDHGHEPIEQLERGALIRGIDRQPAKLTQHAGEVEPGKRCIRIEQPGQLLYQRVVIAVTFAGCDPGLCQDGRVVRAQRQEAKAVQPSTAVRRGTEGGAGNDQQLDCRLRRRDGYVLHDFLPYPWTRAIAPRPRSREREKRTGDVEWS